MKYHQSDLYSMQATCHRYGCDDFLHILVQVMQNASSDMEHIDMEASEHYQDIAGKLQNIIEEKKL